MNKEWIPNSLTMSNGIFGFLSIIMTSNKLFDSAIVFIILSVTADRYDGIVARKLGVESEIGKQLDSLCDLISFGIAPAFLVYSKAQTANYSFLLLMLIALVAAIYVSCGAYRLGRFNITSMENGFFSGVPITAAGCLLAFLSISYFSVNTLILTAIMIILSYLMVSKVKIKKM
ncbi:MULTISPECIES: CDP-diacylglycerol--serine O-phosphatidyltransferase [unclassified Gemella]|uniref:CDP-diacylglycerol--serine O-phosphatidyltransferase n=1 Tax=unclassified Gemella TaxID=2624949 RepID=UPI0010747B2F|nr:MULTISPECIES: CDP-diacylglycerol--serine O-phosphatidyltransferase [unclassified Gemella]MBF0709839.1 CDP-diacylglycerol--serine O-phosphatidyltransferase [Gemella sp. GL1.1]MBF0746856.1 CDP-diacylglycerol--serine O-phosphatidyltransferase [Gemella sp. 19428wG2_WT2a]NYS27183.1 CDP-diacylglycerol--serine O-phosphatidyltransferase [Gemella sp. GL1]TFU59579.1 CDP-diacylglycerol--serine O-phosphatidyltransferase [Gemella sp. WT2a]